MVHTKRLLVGALALAFVSSTFAATTPAPTAATPTVTASGVASAAKTSLPAPTNLKIVLKTDTTVSLQWDKVVGASSYIVKYDKKSIATSKDPLAQYESETDPLTGTGKVIEKLLPNTEYFFSVVSLNDKMDESDLYSNEISVKTDMAGAVAAPTAVASTGVVTGSGAPTATPAAPALALLQVTPVDNQTINLVFNNTLSADPVNVKITKVADNADVAVASVTPDVANAKQVVVKLSSMLDPTTPYKLVVLAAKDSAGTNVVNGPDGEKEFTTDANLAVAPGALTLSGATGTGLTASGAAASELPKTGAQENLVIIVSLLLAGVLVYAYRARKA
jgi:LPXTG-motif cell wall-anchored protein